MLTELKQIREALLKSITFWEDFPENEDGSNKYDKLPCFIGLNQLNKNREALVLLDTLIAKEEKPCNHIYVVVPEQPGFPYPSSKAICKFCSDEMEDDERNVTWR